MQSVRNYLYQFLVFIFFTNFVFAAPQDEIDRTQQLGSSNRYFNLRSLVDEVLEEEFENELLSGAAVSAVLDDEILFLKGYGYSNLEENISVDPTNTIFKIASVSKIFTWVAIMQLVEAGEISLDENVNTYLKEIEIPKTFDENVLVSHLLAHTAGFEDQVIGIAKRSFDELTSLEEFLRINMPNRIFPPGKYIAYSNYGTNLAGQIVSDVSNRSFDEYMETEILFPLGMRNSTYREPLPQNLSENFAIPYRVENGRLVEAGFEWLHDNAASGGLATSASDMARFMISLLSTRQTESLDSNQVLSRSSIEQLFSQLYTQHDSLIGNAHGFWERQVGQTRVLWHSGGSISYYAYIFLVPEERFGFFVVFNSPEAASTRDTLIATLMDSLYRSDNIHSSFENNILKGFEDRVGRIEGSYKDLRRSFTKAEKFISFDTLEVTRAQPGKIKIGNNLYSEIEPFVFKRDGRADRLAFEIDSEGEVSHLLFSNGAMDKQPFYANISAHLLIILVTISLSVFGVAKLLYSQIRNPRNLILDSPLVLSMFLLKLTIVIFVIWIVLAFWGVEGREIIYGYPSSLYFALILPMIVFGLIFVSAGIFVRDWHSGYLTTKVKASTLVYLAITLLFFAILHYWNILFWKL